jgi:2-hydroxymuconate-semialdehyde hydrolase
MGGMARDIGDIYHTKSFTFEGIPVCYLEGGQGFPVLMLHGSGPGAGTIGNWRTVLAPLADRFKIYAMDLIGFGTSGRKPAPPYFDIPLWLRQAKAMVEHIGAPKLGVVGHSVSGALALKLAAAESRVAAVVTTASMGQKFALTEYAKRAWSFPKTRDELRAMAQGMIFNHALIDDTYLANRERILNTGDYATYFSAMFEGDKQRYIDAAVVTDAELAKVKCPVTMLHGRDDQGFPPAISLAISQHLPWADVLLIGRCSHSIALEHPDKLVGAIAQTFQSVSP